MSESLRSTLSDKALVLFSGGQDSTTCLAWAVERFSVVETIGFDYGQRHIVELACRPSIIERLRRFRPRWRDGIGGDHVLDLTVLNSISDTTLTRVAEIKMRDDGIPNTFVPGRNILFLTLAAAVAYRRGIRHIIGGMCETDFSGYPDCRDDTIKALQVALNLGMERRFVLHTPLMWFDKAETWALAEEIGGIALVNLVREETHTCYLGEREVRFDWGLGCGACPACQLRSEGYARYIEKMTRDHAEKMERTNARHIERSP